ncbi:MAG: C1 family peptidase [Deltaproteobacteria bacterium]|nr:C1 family peptidase [Deltaproteobacteria bacterium]
MKKLRLIFLLSFLFNFVFFLKLSAQDFTRGLTPTNESDFQKIDKLVTLPDSEDSKKKEQLPSREDLRRYMPPVGNQGQQGSCAAWATAYGLASFYFGVINSWALTLGNSYHPDHVMSPAFVYRNRPIDPLQKDHSGMNLYEAMRIMINFGNVPFSKLDYSDKVDSRITNKSLYDHALQYRFPKTGLVWRAKTAKPNLDGVEITKLILHQQTPAILSVCANDRFSKIEKVNKNGDIDKSGEFIWIEKSDLCEELEKNKSIPNSKSDVGGHALLAVGYDDAVGPNGSFLIMNSWGTEWGDQGFAWLDYKTFKLVTSDVVSVMRPPEAKRTPDSPPPSPKPRPGFLEVPGENKEKFLANYKRIKPGMLMNEVFDLIAGPSNVTSLQFMYGGRTIAPRDTDRAGGVWPWIYENFETGTLMNVFWKDGRVLDAPVRKVKYSSHQDAQKVENNWKKIRSGMSLDEVMELVGPPNDSIQLSKDGKTIVDREYFFTGPDDNYRIYIQLQNEKVLGKQKFTKIKFAEPNSDLVSENGMKVQVGMRLKNVIDLIGSPIQGTILSWYGADKNNAPQDGLWEYNGKNLTRTFVRWTNGLVSSSINVVMYLPSEKPNPQLVEANWRKLRVGNSKEEVIRLLGEPEFYFKSFLSRQDLKPLDSDFDPEIPNEWKFPLPKEREFIVIRWKNGNVASFDKIREK